MNICKHSIIETVISHSASKPCFNLFYFLFSFLLTINLKLIKVHVEIKIVNKEAATKRSTLFNSSPDTETPFCKSRNESYVAVNLKQFMYFQKAFLACRLFT